MFRRAPKPVRIEVFGKTDLGKTRDHNEDCFLVADLTREEASLQPSVRDHVVGPHGTVFVVADGMGGAAAGDLASEMARSEEHTSELQSRLHLVCRLLLEKKKQIFAH